MSIINVLRLYSTLSLYPTPTFSQYITQVLVHQRVQLVDDTLLKSSLRSSEALFSLEEM